MLSENTIKANQRAGAFADHEELWLFGYGSLIYQAGFDYIERRPAIIKGWARRFWQGSHDHRGTRQAPGRVVTLIPAPGTRCSGLAYRVTPAVFDYLDHREKNGYLRVAEPMHFEDGHVEKGLVYIAGPDNAAWLGEASIDEIAAHIQRAEGPSGPNRDYALKLAEALRSMGADDAHCLAVAERLQALISAE